MKERKGQPLPLGITIAGNKVNFSVEADPEKESKLLLYHAGEETPCCTYEMTDKLGAVRYLSLTGIEPSEYEYNYLIDEKVVVDPYAHALSGREKWGKARDVSKHEVRGVLYNKEYDWEGDEPLQIPYHQVIAYSLHVRGYTVHSSSKVKHRGTFAGLTEKIPYIKDLGVNQIHCMPIYDFEECLEYRNYWGYGDGYFFAPKASYAASGDAVTECKDMVKAFHKAGIEVVLEMPFTAETPKIMIQECLRYYMMEYHIDGFILNPGVVPVDSIVTDPVLKCTKIMVHNLGFEAVMRQFLRGDQGKVRDVMYWLRHHSKKDHIFNYITNQNGFTLNDLVSYDKKHNEKNGENNQDGPDNNFSWNCGAEGNTSKKSVTELREKQMRNAYALVLLAQGTPCILAGDEFANTQKGNNNVYCQDNLTGWIDWRKLEQKKELHDYVKGLIALRKQYPVFCPEKEFLGMDQAKCGVPDVSYHGESAWRAPLDGASRRLGVYYSGAFLESEDCFVAYNMQEESCSFAVPRPQKGKKWYRIMSTDEGVLESPDLSEGQRQIDVDAHSIVVLWAGK